MYKKFSTFYRGLFLIALGGCSGNHEPPSSSAPKTKMEREIEKDGLLFGEPILQTNSSKKSDTTQIGVNTYLWRGTLDVLSFLPLKTVDPYGGLILTNWYTSLQTPNERIKVNVVILSKQLRADGLKVSVFQQIHDPLKGWQDVPVSQETQDKLEETILTRARQLRIQEKISD